MEIKTIQAVSAYTELKALKLATIDDETMFKIWGIIRKLRPFHEEYLKDREDARSSISDSNFEHMQDRLRTAKIREELVKKGEHTLTEDDIKDVREINEYFNAFSAKMDKCLKELDETKIDVRIDKIPSESFLKVLKANDKSFELMEQFEWLLY
jgi:hypothetical protein